MRAVDIIIKKREKQILTRDEIEYFVLGFTKGEIPDYQVSAWAMAVLLNGMTPQESTDLTMAMVNSGETINLSGFGGFTVDKHSTGGVGDKTTLVVLPIVAACGLPVAKMSGHGLGFSGGTLDKMESFPGYRVNLSISEVKKQLLDIGIVLCGQSKQLAPADGILYALRDVTGTVDSIPLIASSIMCKKIAAGAQGIVLDVKVGVGAFMKTLAKARELANLMIAIGELAGRKVSPLISDMNQPLGCAVGNTLEVLEAIETLQGRGPADFLEHCLHLSAYMLVLGTRAEDLESGIKLAMGAINNGSALNKFCSLVQAQGGDDSYVLMPQKFPQATYIEIVPSPRSGWLSSVNARLIAEASVYLGAGREQKDRAVDHAVGLVIHNKVGDEVIAGQPLFTIYANDVGGRDGVKAGLLAAFTWSDIPVDPLPLFYPL